MKYNIIERICPVCKRTFEGNALKKYCSLDCRKKAQKYRRVNREKTLCKQCDTCERFTYQRTLKRGKNKGMLFKFKYCNGNSDIVSKNDWTLQKVGQFRYVASTKDKQLFAYFLKKDKKKDIYYLNRDTLDLCLKNLREISRACVTQMVKRGSTFPGVSKTRNKNGNYSTQMNIHDKLRHIGVYDTEEEAANAYYNKCIEIGREINKESVAYKQYLEWLDNHKWHWSWHNGAWIRIIDS